MTSKQPNLAALNESIKSLLPPEVDFDYFNDQLVSMGYENIADFVVRFQMANDIRIDLKTLRYHNGNVIFLTRSACCGTHSKIVNPAKSST